MIDDQVRREGVKPKPVRPLEAPVITAAIEVVLTMSTITKAINDRFRNLLTIMPNLKIPMFIVVDDKDASAALAEITKPVNVESGLADRVSIVKISELSAQDLISRFVRIYYYRII